MKKKISFLFWVILSCKAFSLDSQIYVIHTAALISDWYEMRKEEYIASLKMTTEYGYQPYVFEACHPGSPSFFEEYTDKICYTNVNDYRLRNKGVNEGRSLIEGFHFFQFKDDDMIIKLTGRYWFNCRDFLQLVEDHPEIDAFVRFTPNHPCAEHMITGCFAMRYKLFKEMLESFDYSKMEEELIDFERMVGSFVLQLPARQYRVMYVNKLGITSNIGGFFPPIYTCW